MAKGPKTVMGFARKIAHQEGIKPISNVALDLIIWGRTGYPHFWDGDPIPTFERQLRQAFQDINSGESQNWPPL